MAILNDWQKVSRVIPGKPFGDGADGDATISATPNTRTTAAGNSGSTTLTLDSAILSNGDLVLIHQTRGTGVGQWEINQVLSGGGTTSITLKKPLQYTYIVSGNSQAQVIKVPRYKALTVNAHAMTNWNGSTGGIEVILAQTSITVSGALTGKGGNGSVSGGDGAGGTGAGFAGGKGRQGQQSGDYGGGNPGASAMPGSGAANGNGGGAGKASGSSNNGGGGGGGASYSGSNGGTSGSAVSGYAWLGQGGIGFSAADFTSFTLGGGGGGAGNGATESMGAGGGGAGGGIFILISKTVILNSTITTSGGHGANGWRAGGGGAGGGTLLICQDATLGTNNIVSDYGGGGLCGGSGGEGSHYSAGEGASGTPGDGGNGGNGRKGIIAVHHSGTVTGTTNPTAYTQLDPSLVEATAGGAFLFNMI